MATAAGVGREDSLQRDLEAANASEPLMGNRPDYTRYHVTQACCQIITCVGIIISESIYLS